MVWRHGNKISNKCKLKLNKLVFVLCIAASSGPAAALLERKCRLCRAICAKRHRMAPLWRLGKYGVQVALAI